MKTTTQLWNEKKQIAQTSYPALAPLNTHYGSQIKSDFLKLDWENILKSSEKNEPLEKYPLNKEIKIYTLNTLPPDLFHHYFTKLIDIKETKVTALHYTLLQSLTCIVIPKNQTIKEPIFLTTSFQKGLNASHIIILAEEHSQAQIYDLSEYNNTTLATNFREIFIHNNAKINYYTINNMNQETSFHNIQAELHENAHLKTYEFLIEGKSQHIFNVNSVKQKACFHYNAAFLANHNTKYDLLSSSNQQSKKTSSSLIIKGICTDNSQSLFRGRIKINPQAKFSSGHQHSSLLLFGDKAHADAVPILEVENNEVSCSHGAILSRINEDQLFYLQSRGISEKQSQELLIHAHLNPIINQFPEVLQEKIYSLINQKLTLKNEILTLKTI